MITNELLYQYKYLIAFKWHSKAEDCDNRLEMIFKNPLVFKIPSIYIDLKLVTFLWEHIEDMIISKRHHIFTIHVNSISSWPSRLDLQYILTTLLLSGKTRVPTSVLDMILSNQMLRLQ